MHDIGEARHEMEQAERSAAKVTKASKTAILLMNKLFKFVARQFDKIFHFSAGEKSYKEITNSAVNTEIVENLSKEDLRELKRYAKQWNMKYAIIKVKDEEVQKVNILSKVVSLLKKEKEEANYSIIYDSKFNEVMTKVLKNVASARIQRQTSMDPSQRTDFNKDGVVDEKDLNIEPKTNDIKSDDLKLNHEYGTVNKIEFRDKEHTIFEVSKTDFEKIYLETQVEVQSFAATVVRNLKNEEVVAISISPKNRDSMKNVFLAYDVVEQSEMIVNYDTDKSRVDPDHCYHLEMNDQEFEEFKEQYKETSFNAYKTDAQWSVIINSNSVKKNFEKNTNTKSLEDLYKEIQPSKDNLETMEKTEDISHEINVDDLDLDDIELEMDK